MVVILRPRLELDCLILSLICDVGLLLRVGESMTLMEEPKFLLSLADYLSMPRRARTLNRLTPVFGRAFMGILVLLFPITIEAFEVFLSSVVVLSRFCSRGDFALMLRFVRLYDL